jgi:tyrosyl-DNA phosphodiesterase 2
VYNKTSGRLRAATCHLVGPNPSFTGSTHRRARAAAFLEHFDAVHQQYGRSFVLDENVVLGGDLGWDDDLDGPLRLPDGWVDAWHELRGGGDGGWTYDAVANPMLRGLTKPEQRRADRFVCKLRDFTLDSVEMVGVDPISGVTRFDDNGNALHVLPSHHYGLLLTVSPN